MRARLTQKEEANLFQLLETIGIDKKDVTYDAELRRVEIDPDKLSHIMRDFVNYLNSASGIVVRKKIKGIISENYSDIKNALS